MKKPNIPFEYKISTLYIIIGALWILFSDNLVLKFTQDPKEINTISIYKGWFYVLITGMLLFILIKKEIRKRNNLYSELYITNRKAIESDQLKTAFLRNISHYIRTPMNSILGFVDLLKNRNLDEEKRKHFHHIVHEQSTHLLELINNILEISKIHTNQMELFKKQFHINKCISEILRTTECLKNESDKPITLRAVVSLPDDRDKLYSDEEKIKRILYELLSNALKFTESGEIEFGYIYENNCYTFFVKDTGKGISDDMKKHLFNQFMLANPNDSMASKGSGLGLYLCSGLVNLLNGKIWIEYSGHNGSKFCFTIPTE
jgi:signal transduction histidine kinase